MEYTANYHTHTARCGHAKGSDREYIEAALAAGFTTLGFSDHSPMVFDTPGFYSGFRIRPEEAEDYFSSLTALKREYADRLEIHIGVEVEYYPATHEKYTEYMKQFPVEYKILGQHFILREEDGRASIRETDDPARLKAFYDNVLEGAATGDFLYVAHPDIVNFVGNEAVYAEETERFLRGIRQIGIPLEINRLGYAEKRCYPRELFWRLAGETGCTAVIGADAHAPEHLLDRENINGCIAVAEKYGLPIVSVFPFPENK